MSKQMTQTQLMRDIDANDRPREKAIKDGFKSLTDAEVMAIIFGTGMKGISVVDLCQKLLDKNQNHLSLVTRKSVKQLVDENKGIGEVKAISLLAALELGRRATEDAKNLAKEDPITTSADFYDRMKHHFMYLNHEEFWVFYLDRGGRVIKEVNISRGSTYATSVDVKLITKYALDCCASSVVLSHNHPSGNLRPSSEDDSITRSVMDALRLFNIRVFDHIIFTDGGYYSYSDHSRL